MRTWIRTPVVSFAESLDLLQDHREYDPFPDFILLEFVAIVCPEGFLERSNECIALFLGPIANEIVHQFLDL